MAEERVSLPADILSEIAEQVYRPRQNDQLDQVSRPSYHECRRTADQMAAADSLKTLQALRLTNHSWRNATTPLLFRSVVVYSIAVSTIRKLNGLAMTPYLANAVQEVLIKFTDPWMGLDVGEQYISEQNAFLKTGDLNVALTSALQAFPHLSSFVLDYGVNDKYRTYRVLPAFASILSCSLPKLSYLVLRGVELAPYVPIGSELPSLTRLHITLFSSPFRKANLGIPARLPLLLSALPNLTFLSLALGDCHDEALTPVNWAPARLCHLRHLKLKDINITEKAIMDLVTNSASTLEKLEFHQIWLKDSSWASIYTIFCDLLNALTDFTMVNSQYASRWNGRRSVRPKFSDFDVDCFFALFDVINQRRARKGMSVLRRDYIIAGSKKKYRNKGHFSRSLSDTAVIEG